MTDEQRISGHYSSGQIMERLRAALAAEGVDSDHPTVEQLAPFDHFHGRGLEATQEAANLVAATPADHVLDVGSGIGGPARYFARRFGCRVTGIDLTAEFCEAARALTRAVGLADRVAFEAGNALAMPFGDARFDGAYSMNVSMNIADKAGLYREVRRVLKPGAWFVLAEIAQGPAGPPNYPTPWAKTAETSFLTTPEATLEGLAAAGFAIVQSRDTAAAAAAFTARARAMIARGEKPPFHAVYLIHGDLAREMAANGARDLAAGKIIPIEILCRAQ
ncbi:MAG TPA: methyltransferase domain-containing protein [Xanthobacteraceae bacterium]|jgi:ubiquinone/menaquinone biosynthesis C-methylase UbiE|nr:methyltransferase domain-containing protein [Xanthobacteraceae bacterium]